MFDGGGGEEGKCLTKEKEENLRTEKESALAVYMKGARRLLLFPTSTLSAPEETVEENV